MHRKKITDPSTGKLVWSKYYERVFKLTGGQDSRGRFMSADLSGVKYRLTLSILVEPTSLEVMEFICKKKTCTKE